MVRQMLLPNSTLFMLPLIALMAACSGSVTSSPGTNTNGQGDTDGQAQGGGGDTAGPGGDGTQGSGDAMNSGDGMQAGDSDPCAAAEICDDNIDNDCNDAIDDGCGCIDTELRPCGEDIGACTAGVQTCSAGTWGDCVGGVASTDETCDGIDNNCDGDTDEGCPCTGVETQSCGIDEGECALGTQTCDVGNWGPCEGGTGTAPEVCDGLDNNCDGNVDDGLGPRAAANTEGACAGNLEVCGGASGWGDASANYAPTSESCDGIDNDCTNGVDDGMDPTLLSNQEGACSGNQQICDGANGYVGDPSNHTVSRETCDGLDNDCANGADDGLTTQLLANQDGECVGNFESCDGLNGWVEGDTNYIPTGELCDNLDNDCINGIDDGLTTQATANQDGPCAGDMEACKGSAGWVPETGNHPKSAETCDGVDNDCTNGVDDGLPDRPTANQEGLCSGNVQTCSGSSGWVADSTNHTPVAETCDGADNDCTNGVDDGMDPIATGSQDGLCSGNQDICDGSNGYIADPTNYVVTAEVCGDADDADCDGAPNNGCDTDGDGYCDDGMVVAVDNPKICSSSLTGAGNDCDDIIAAVNPGAAEDCLDGIDNNCDGRVDTDDIVACPPIAVNITTNPVLISHSGSANVTASHRPAGTGYTSVWSVTDAQPSADCSTADVVLTGMTDGNWNTRITVALDTGFDATKLTCSYTLEARVNGYAFATTSVQFTNDAPRVTDVAGATWTGSAWILYLPAGATPTITATATDADGDTPIDIDWIGADAGSLACAPNCAVSLAGPAAVSAVDWAAAIAPGTHTVTVETHDQFDATQTNAVDIVIEVDNCLWVAAGGTGDGSTPGAAMGSIQGALDAAKLVADTAACVMGDGPFSENLNLPVDGANHPNLLGGFDMTGAPSANRPRVLVDDLGGAASGGVTFDSGYSGIVRRFGFVKDPGLATPMGIPVVTVDSASPDLTDLMIGYRGADSPVGLLVTSGVSLAASSTMPTLSGSTIQAVGAVVNATGVSVTESTGGNSSPSFTMSSITAENCTGVCRGIWAQPGTHVNVRDNELISGQSADDTSIGIDLEGAAGNTVSAIIRGNTSIQAGTVGGTTSVRIRMKDAQRVSIVGNAQIGNFDRAGSEFDAAISDGSVARDGSTSPGNSTLITISDNTQISGGFFWAVGCGEGPDVSAGIVLVGTTNVTIANNGNYANMFSGITGGGSSTAWDPTTRLVPPSTPGLWLIDTTSVTLTNNRVNAGGMGTGWGCPPPAVLPDSVAYRDGLPPGAVLAPPASNPQLASSGTVLARNGIICDRPPENSGIGGGLLSWCSAIELNGPLAGNAPMLVNNYIVGANANYMVGLRQRGGGGVAAINNTFETDLMVRPIMLTMINDDSLSKWPILLESIDDDGIDLINNIVYTRRDHNGPDNNKDLEPERLCIREVVDDAAAGSGIGTMLNNLFYIERDDLANPVAPYIRVTDGTGGSPDPVEYNSSEVDTVAGVTNISGNFAAAPGLDLTYTQVYEKPTSRLLAGSEAIDAGVSVAGVPKGDMDGDVRPGASTGIVDIGHDETR